jgi:hypothetical protein
MMAFSTVLRNACGAFFRLAKLQPHYHIHIWHVSKKGEERVAK